MGMCVFKKRYDGYSVVEVMVVMAIIGIMSAALIVSVGSSREKKTVESEALKVAASIREAKNYALTGKTLDTANNFPCDGRFVAPVTAPATNYYVKYGYRTSANKCSDGANGTAPSAGTVSSGVLQDGVKFTVVPASPNGRTIFSVPFGVIMNEGVSPPMRYVISKGNSSYTICVSASGIVSTLEGNVGC
jgi:prepilin-type N-terminal cleavage/methylation domain-containing protein